MRLIPISEHPDHAKILYDLLAERTAEQSISHREVPTLQQHLDFIEKMDPDNGYLEERYGEWNLIEVDDVIVGSIYVTQRDEIGISIFKLHQRKGYGTAAIGLQIKQWGRGRYLANINPLNEASRKMFEKLGFKHIQNTYALEAE